MSQIEYCMFNKSSNERFDLGTGRWDLLFPVSTIDDRKEFKLGDIVSSIKELIHDIHNDYKLRPGVDDKLNDEYVKKVAEKLWDWTRPPPAPPKFELWTKTDFEQNFRGDMSLEEFLKKYPYSESRFFV